MDLGNPLRFTDPSGHRATHWTGDPDDGEDGLCWALAYTIANIWNETDIGNNALGVLRFGMILMLFFGTLSIVGGYAVYITWFSPQAFQRYLEFYARFYRHWNQEQTEWVQSKAFFWTARFGTMLFLAIILLGFVTSLANYLAR